MTLRDLFLLGLGLFALKAMRDDDTPTTPGGRRPGNVSREERQTVLRELSALGWPEDELNAAIRTESGWRTDARNPYTDASGLIQLMPFWFAKQTDFRPELSSGREKAAVFRTLNALEQLPLIRRYFTSIHRKWRVPGDTYMALAAPAYVGVPDSTLIWEVGTKAWQQNPPWREYPDGPITAGSIRRVLLRQMRRA